MNNMYLQTLIGIMIPFVGTTLGSTCVFLLKKDLKPSVQKTLLGFASGVMIAASVWSLLIPSIDYSSSMGKLAFIPSAVGIVLGMLFLFLLDIIIPHLHINSNQPEGLGNKKKLNKSLMLLLAVTLHNIPEGMAPGIVFAGVLNRTNGMNITGAMVLAIGMAVQNFPEGAIISLSLASNGENKWKSFLKGMLSGAVEPVAAIITILLTSLLVPVMPYLLSFAAGAMIYVVIEELIPEANEGEHTNHCTIGFGIGFVLMMILDVALG